MEATQEYKFLKCKISSNLEELNNLHRQYHWIPNSEQVRPSPEILERKLSDIEEIQKKWVSFKDFIYYRVFDKQYNIRNDKLIVFDKDLTILPRMFKKNDYPYQVNGNHYILWYSTQIQSVSDERITKDINNELYKLLLHHQQNSNNIKKDMNTNTITTTTTNDTTTTNSNVAVVTATNTIQYDYVWYLNPKISVPDFFHVQVFWITL